MLAECDGKRMLLTGDARDDHVLAGLDEAGIAKDGKTHVDILKLPHHGSIRNIARGVLRARHRRSLRHLRRRAPRQPRDRDAGADRRGPRQDDDFTIHLTNRVGTDDLEARLDAFLAAKERLGPRATA